MTTVIPNSFSFNSPVGACQQCRGFGRTIGIDYRLVIPDEGKTLAGGAIRPWQTKSNQECQRDLVRYAKQRGVPIDVPWRELTREQRAWVIDGEGSWRQRKWYGVARFFAWLESKAYKMHVRVLLSKYRSYDVCPTCSGARLKPESLLWRLGSLADAAAVVDPERRFRARPLVAPEGGHLPALGDEAFAALPGLSIHDLMMLPVERTLAFFERVELPQPLDDAAELVLGEIRNRLRYLRDVGLRYLTLDRQSRTLSGGEVQRINLTTALGTSLVNTLFVLDEPSVGLHPRDLGRIVEVLAKLRDAGNTLLVVEHDAQVMLAADRIIDMGPGPGRAGGRVVFNGSPAALTRDGESLTAKYLRGELKVDRGRTLRGVAEHDPRLVIRGAREHNLRDVDVGVPLNRLVCVTGVSGSGKSTLVEDVLYNGLLKLLGKPKEPPGEHSGLEGFESLTDVVLVDQAPIGRTTRSNPASFVGVLEPIRQLFAAEPLARERRYTAGTFSFNTGNGRCPVCSGNGFEHVEMQFLSDVYLRCAECNGRRYRGEVLEVKLALGEGSRAEVDRRRARDDGRGGARLLRRPRRRAGALAAARRRRARVPDARASRADAVGRRGATAEARGRARRRRCGDYHGDRARGARCSCSTSRRRACTSPTWRSSLRRSTGSSRPGTRSSSSSTTSTSSRPPIGSSISAPKAATTAAPSSRPALPPPSAPQASATPPPPCVVRSRAFGGWASGTDRSSEDGGDATGVDRERGRQDVAHAAYRDVFTAVPSDPVAAPTASPATPPTSSDRGAPT